jgi:hypothetical protein
MVDDRWWMVDGGWWMVDDEWWMMELFEIVISNTSHFRIPNHNLNVFFSCFYDVINDDGLGSNMTFDNAKIQNSGRMALKQDDCSTSVSIDSMLPC